jgi:hypothetical protein
MTEAPGIVDPDLFDEDDGTIIADSGQAGEDKPQEPNEGQGEETSPLFGLEDEESQQQEKPEEVPVDPEKYAKETKEHANLRSAYGRQAVELGELRKLKERVEESAPKTGEPELPDDLSLYDMTPDQFKKFVGGAVKETLAEEKAAWQAEQAKLAQQEQISSFMSEKGLGLEEMKRLGDYMTENDVYNIEKAHKLAILEGVLPQKEAPTETPTKNVPSAMREFPVHVGRAASGKPELPKKMSDLINNWEDKIKSDEDANKILRRLQG